MVVNALSEWLASLASEYLVGINLQVKLLKVEQLKSASARCAVNAQVRVTERFRQAALSRLCVGGHQISCQ